LQYEFAPKAQRVTVGLPASLVDAVKKEAARVGFPTSDIFGRYWKRLFTIGVDGSRHPIDVDPGIENGDRPN
jgi:hypothetical protein